ncbi:hypothetical protein ACEPPN_017898 [Leptodophora sp. 'Broadleaf-Isolate-01']
MQKLSNWSAYLHLHWNGPEAEGGSPTSVDIRPVVSNGQLTRYHMASEQKMDRIDARLAEIERLLKSSTSCPHPEIALPQAPVRDSARFQLSTLPLPTENSLRIRLDEYVAKEDDNLALEANQHVASAAVFATELVGNAIKRVSIDDYTPMMNKALDSLQQIVGMKKFLEGNPQGQCRRMCFPNHEPMPQGGFRELSMPPIAVVVPLLEGLKGKDRPSPYASVYIYAWKFLS